MAKQPRKTQPVVPSYNDEIDLMELLHFVVRGSRFWVGGGLIFALLAIIYALTIYPSSFRQQTINDIGLTQESLTQIRQVLPAMTIPIEETMRANNLDGLYEDIVKNTDFLNDVIIGLTGTDLKDKSLDREAKAKIDTILIQTKGQDINQMQREVNFLRQHLKGVSQYLSLKSYLDEQVFQAKLTLFNQESFVNQQRLSYERSERQLESYQALQKESNGARDLQITLNLSNQDVAVDDLEAMNNITEFTGAKYLPLGNRIVGLKSEMADQLEAVRIAQRQIEALKLTQRVLNDLVLTFEQFQFKGNPINFAPMFEVVYDYRQQLDGSDTGTLEDIAALDTLEATLIRFENNELKFKNTLPAVIDQSGRGAMVIISTLVGAILGFVLFLSQAIANSYRKRYS